MNFYLVLLVVLNALSCLAAHESKLAGAGVEPGCNDLQKGVIAGTPLVLSYSIPPQVNLGFVNLYRDFYPRCPFGPTSALGVYVKSCEACPSCMGPTIAVTFDGSPSDRIDIYRNSVLGINNIQVTVYCGLQAKP